MPVHSFTVAFCKNLPPKQALTVCIILISSRLDFVIKRQLTGEVSYFETYTDGREKHI